MSEPRTVTPQRADARARVEPGTRRDIGTPAWLFARAAGRALRTEPPHVFTTLGRSRGLFTGWLHFAGRLMPFGRLPRRDGELVILRVASLAGCEYERRHHEILGARAGLTRQEMDRVRLGPDAPGWSGRQRVLLLATDELVATRDLTDATWARVREHLDEPRAIELLMLIGHYDMLAATLTALRVQPDAPR